MVYLIHIARFGASPIHYIGYTRDGREHRRLLEHAHGQGSKFVRRKTSTGDLLVIARLWPAGDPVLERRLKNRRNHASLCPLCTTRLQEHVPWPIISARASFEPPVKAEGFPPPTTALRKLKR